MQQLEEIVNFYLTTETNYALMITGEWGVGKTYYFKNILKKQISETPTFGDNSKKYRPILVSLFGLKSIEEIQTEILLSLYPILKNKGVKLGASIGKALLKGLMQLKNLGQYYDVFSEVEVDKEDWIKFSDLVICFDDLERLSENLNIEELIGYINSLVENDDVKILIIANENKIDRKNYFALKEKVVGNTIEFIPDIKKSYDSLIEINFSGNTKFKEFLKKEKGFILDVITKKSSNLRILSFALTYFNRIFSEITKNLPSYEILKEKDEEILLILLKFTLVISIEYKEGRISFKKKENLDSGIEFDWKNFSIGSMEFADNKQKKEEEKSYREKFIEKYYSGETFNYFGTVYDFITGGSMFNFEDLIIDLKRFYHIEENQILPHYEVLSQLGYTTVFSLSDKKYKRLTSEMLRYSDQGLYDITNYITVFYFASRFGNPLKLNLDKLEKRIINGMHKGKAKYKFQDSLDFYITVSENSEHKEQLLRIRKVALQLNNEINSTAQLNESKALEKLCYENFENFFNEVLDRNSQYYYTPIFKNFNPLKFYRFFLRSNGELRWKIVSFWRSRYRDYPPSQLKEEVFFLETLKNKLEIKIGALPNRGLSSFIYTEFLKILQSSIDKLNEIKLS